MTLLENVNQVNTCVAEYISVKDVYTTQMVIGVYTMLTT